MLPDERRGGDSLHPAGVVWPRDAARSCGRAVLSTAARLGEDCHRPHPAAGTRSATRQASSYCVRRGPLASTAGGPPWCTSNRATRPGAWRSSRRRRVRPHARTTVPRQRLTAQNSLRAALVQPLALGGALVLHEVCRLDLLHVRAIRITYAWPRWAMLLPRPLKVELVYRMASLSFA
jgi:hypothetical protein